MRLIIDIPEEIYKHIRSMQFYIPGLRSGKSPLEKKFSKQLEPAHHLQKDTDGL